MSYVRYRMPYVNQIICSWGYQRPIIPSTMYRSHTHRRVSYSDLPQKTISHLANIPLTELQYIKQKQQRRL